MMNVVFMGATSGYPDRYSADNTKCEFIAKALIEQGVKVSTLNAVPIGDNHDAKMTYGVTSFGYHYYSLPYSKKIWGIIQNLRKTKFILKQLREVQGPNIIFIGMPIFPVMLCHILVGRFLGYRIATLYHEYFSSWPYRDVFRYVDYRLVDRLFGYFCHYIFPISHFLENKASRFRKPMMILPVLADASINRTSSYSGGNNFTFCGHVGYILRYTLILDAFRVVVRKKVEARLTLVLYGNINQLAEAENMIDNMDLKDFVCIKTNLTFSELNTLYDESLGLLIPLQPDSVQDVARFSQKIAEYTMSGRPIITTNVGEIPYYFINNESAIVADYTVDSFSKGMLLLLNDKSLADKVGFNGKKVATEHFYYKMYGKRLKDVLANN